MSTVRTTSRWTYPLDSGGNNFSFDNLALTAADVVATVYDSLGNMMAPSTYSITGVGDNAGGTVVFENDLQAIAGGTLVIELEAPRLTMGSDPQDYIQDPAATRRFNQDQRLLLPQQLWNRMLRSLMFSPLDNDGFQLPPAPQRAGKLLGFDAAGAMCFYQPTGEIPWPAPPMTPIELSADGTVGSEAHERGVVQSGSADVILTFDPTLAPGCLVPWIRLGPGNLIFAVGGAGILLTEFTGYDRAWGVNSSGTAWCVSNIDGNTPIISLGGDLSGPG